jgi:glucosamine--fructose-6-phosphate aminotransferase (isomerizing)
MCGIFAAINNTSVTGSLLEGLKALSYRGYDSAGIAIIGNNGIERRRAQGKLENLAKTLSKSPLNGLVGIAHTRWATHGEPSKSNAHPHMTAQVAVAHNGIIENYQLLRDELEQKGYIFKSDTDSEAIPILLTHYLKQGMSHYEAIREAQTRLVGSYAIVVIFNDKTNTMYAARRGSPLVIGQSDNGFYIASDANALITRADKVCQLEEGEIVELHLDGMKITDSDDQPVTRKFQKLTTTSTSTSKNGYRHYMLKEIYEQPEVIKRTLANYIDDTKKPVTLLPFPFKLDKFQRLMIIACGTSSYAGMVAKYWFEEYASVTTNVDIASEARYRFTPVSSDSISLFISQSGETADTLATLRHAKQQGQTCISIVNVDNTSMTHESDGLLRTYAGTEIGVASTKAFTAQLAVLLLLSISVARQKNQISQLEQQRLIVKMSQIPDLMKSVLYDGDEKIQQISKKFQHTNNLLYLGRGSSFPLALEGALKLKEVSYIHAEAHPSGELKHGPIALVDAHMYVIIIAPPGPLFNKSLSNLREVASRGGKIILISNQEGVDIASNYIEDAIVMPEVDDIFTPLLYVLPLQLLAYHTAILKGTDVDQPRNLAKSVTVE